MRRELRYGLGFSAALLGAAALPGGCQVLVGLDPVQLEGGGGVGGADGGGVGGADGGGVGGAPSTCMDGQRDGKETDIDCGGGQCPACADGKGCLTGSDCVSKVCTGGHCIPPSCTDGVKNGNETDVDCGGGACMACGPGKHCGVAGDCQSNICTATTCADTYLWAKGYGDSTSTSSIGSAVGVDAAGNVVVAGVFTGTIDLGCGMLSAQSATWGDIFVAKLAGADAKCLWSHSFGQAGGSYGVAMAVTKAGGVTLFGSYTGTLNFGGMDLTTSGTDLYAVTFDTNGNHVWSQSIHSSNSSASPGGVAVDGMGNVAVTGSFKGSLTFGTGMISSDPTAAVFVAILGAGGTPIFADGYGDGLHDQGGTSIAADAAGNVVVLGHFSGTVNFDPAAHPGNTMQSGGPGDDAFLAKLHPDGTLAWSEHFSGFPAMTKSFYNVAVDATGDVIVSGALDGAVNFGGATLKSNGGTDVFVVKLDPGGNHLWSQRFGDSNDQAGWTSSADAAGNVFVVSSFQGTVDFGGGPLTSVGMGDVAVVKFDPTGNHLWSRRYGTAQEDDAAGVAAGAMGRVFVAVDSNGPIDFGGGPLMSTGARRFAVAGLLSP